MVSGLKVLIRLLLRIVTMGAVRIPHHIPYSTNRAALVGLHRRVACSGARARRRQANHSKSRVEEAKRRNLHKVDEVDEV